MRKLLNTLYVTNPQAYLSKDGENIVVSLPEGKRPFPIHNLEGVVCFGYPGASPQLMAMCAERGVALSFVSEYGKFLCRVTGKVSGNVLLRKRQYRLSENAEESGKLARDFVLGKLLNGRNVLNRFRRDYPQRCDAAFLNCLELFQDNIKALYQCDLDVDSIRGIEGFAAKTYFEAFDKLILLDEEEFHFSGRSKHPPLDRVNALLSFIYVLFAHDVASALETVGLDPQVGFLHQDRPGRNSLALDLMEELRPYLADRLALTLLNTRVLKANDFVQKENGAVLLHPDSRKIVLTHWQKRKKEVITHPILDEKIEIGLIPYAQSLLLARYIRGDIEEYPPYVVK